MARVIEYDAVESLDEEDVFLIDGDDGTRTVTVQDLRWALFEDVPEMHRNIYRGKNIGSSITDDQLGYIADGTYHDMYIGDYWLDDNGYIWRIADIDYFPYLMASSVPHIVVVPDEFPNSSLCPDDFDWLENTLYRECINLRATITLATELLMSSWCSSDYVKAHDSDGYGIDLMTSSMLVGHGDDSDRDLSVSLGLEIWPVYPQFSLFRLRPAHIADASTWLQNIDYTTESGILRYDADERGFGYLESTESVSYRPFVCISA